MFFSRNFALACQAIIFTLIHFFHYYIFEKSTKKMRRIIPLATFSAREEPFYYTFHYSDNLGVHVVGVIAANCYLPKTENKSHVEREPFTTGVSM